MLYFELKDKKAFILEKETPDATWEKSDKPYMTSWWNGVSANLDYSNPEAVKWFNAQLDRLVAERTADLQRTVAEREAALEKARLLSGLIPICFGCKKIRDDAGYWTQLEVYISEHSDATFSHGLCEECLKRLYPGV